MLKPAELIELRGTGPLTLQDRRVFNLLIENAWGPDIANPSKVFTIATADLRVGGETPARLADTVERLMRVIVKTQDADGGETRLQLLSTNTIKTTANAGTLSYSFPPRLAELVKDSTIFAKLDLEVMRSFSSKYAFALYESVARRVRLRYKFTEEMTLEEMRDLLGVEAGKLAPFKNLWRKAIEPALTEVNAITPYLVTIMPRKEGRKVVGFVWSWAIKDVDGMKQAYTELHRPKVGRKERLQGTADAPVIEQELDPKSVTVEP
jgi:plasmid replication initiation protein